MTISTKKKVESTWKPVEDVSMLPMVEVKPEEKPVEAKLVVKEQKSTDIVKVKVLVGTLQFEQGTFSKGDAFTTTRERVKLFDQTDIQILE